MASSKPTIVIVPGSFSTPSMYAVFVDHLQWYGFDTVCVDLPSCGRRDPQPAASMADDAAAIRAVVEKLVDAGKSVVLVAHSYGGIPATESVKGLSAKDRGAGKGGVERIVYAAAMAPAVGSSSASLLGDVGADQMELSDDGYLKIKDATVTGPNVFSHLPPAEQIESVKRFPEHSAISFGGELTHAGYLDVPVNYLLATQDKTILPEVQERIIGIMKDAGADVTVERFESDHCWNAYIPRSTAVMVLKAIGASI